jgi:DNA-binding transcriptional LysR family regulator
LSASQGTAILVALLASLPKSMSRTRHLRSGALETVLNDWISDPIPVFVAYQPNRYLSTKVRVFIDWLAALFASNESTAKSERRAKA